MDYDLALKLKNAGFIQRNPVIYKSVTHTADGNLITEGESVHMPTLEELIDACGDRFDGVRREDKDQWGSSGWDTDNTALLMVGSTPSEAVANLYLLIHGHKAN